MRPSAFFKGLSWLLVLNLLVKPVWILLIDRQVQNIVGHEAYGKYFAVLNLSLVLYFLADAGMTNMLNQRIAARHDVNLRQLLRIKIFLLLAYAAICFLVAWLSGITHWELVIYVVLIQMLTSAFLFLRGLITAHQFFASDAWFSIADKLLMVLVCGVLIYSSWFGQMALLLFLQIQAVCIALALAVAFVFVLSRKLVSGGPGENSDLLLKQVLPFALIILLMGMHNRLDGFLLERTHHNGAYEAGVYASAFRLLDAANMAGYLAGSFLIPFIARHRYEKKLIEAVVIHTRHGLMFLSMVVVAFSIVFAGWIQQLLYHSSDAYISLIIQLCLSVLPAYYLIHIYGAVLTAVGAFGVWIRILVTVAMLNLVLNLLLIPAYGAMGACIAALSSQYVCAVAVYVVASIKTNIGFYYRSTLLYLGTAALLAALFYFARVALINVWIILALACLIMVLLLTRKLKSLTKYFISLQ